MEKSNSALSASLLKLSLISFFRLKVDETGEILIIPIDIEVDVNGGLYAPDDLIDFGIGGTGDQPKVLKLYLKNSGKRAIKIQVS